MLRFLTDSRVCQGPFRGMHYLDQSVGSSYTPKLLGSYECELHRILSGLPQLPIRRCVDIGAAEGYYAVGLARLLPCAVSCFELDRRGQELIRQLAAANGVSDRVNVLGRCTPDALQALIPETSPASTFLLCDVEGFEDVLLDPIQIPSLAQCWILVEVHEFAVRGIGERLKHRFESTHSIEYIPQSPRNPRDFPSGPFWTHLFPGALRVRVMQEGRPEAMSWLWLAPKGACAGRPAPTESRAL